MTLTPRMSDWLENTHQVVFRLYAITAAFLTYFAMCAFRKPFTAGVYDGLSIWGLDYKIVAIIAQMCGYTLSKFLGLRTVSELKASYRIKSVIILIGEAWISLLFFGLTPRPCNVLFLFLDGLPLGMIWGIVFSFLEGRRFTELLGAGMACSFIVSSGIVKAVGRSLVVSHGVSEFWMPFWTGLLFVPALVLGVFLLSAIPVPSAGDESHRTKRIPMDSHARRHVFISFALGIVLTVSIYLVL